MVTGSSGFERDEVSVANQCFRFRFAYPMKISIITAVFNNRDTVAEALESVLTQSYGNVELVVIDGGSTDGTLEVLKGYEARLGFFVSESDGGIYDALNKGIRFATGDVVGFLHSDDVLADCDVLLRVARAMAGASNVDAVYGDLVYVRKENLTHVVRWWRAGNFNTRKLSFGWMPPHPTFYARKSVYERWGGFDTTYRIAADYDCMLRFMKCGLKLTYIPHVQVRMRVGGASNRSLQNIVRKSVEDYRAMRRNSVGGLWVLAAKNLRKVTQYWSRDS